MLTYEPLNIDSAVDNLIADIDRSPQTVRDYVMNHRLSYRRLPASSALGYVATVYGLTHGDYRRVDHQVGKAESAFYDGSVLALRAILTTSAAKIGLKLGLTDVDPLVVLANPEADKGLAAQGSIIDSRAAITLSEPAVTRLPFGYWSEANGEPAMTDHIKSGFGFTLESARLAAAQKVDAELMTLVGGEA